MCIQTMDRNRAEVPMVPILPHILAPCFVQRVRFVVQINLASRFPSEVSRDETENSHFSITIQYTQHVGGGDRDEHLAR